MTPIRKKTIAFLAAAIAGLPAWAEGTAAENDSTASRRDLGEVVVTGTRQPAGLDLLPMTVSIVDRGDLTADYRMSVMPTLMEQVPGLMVTSRGVMGYGVSNGGSGGMMLRGVSSGGGQVMVLIDGKPQYSGIYGHSVADSYLTMMADRVEVLRGPASMLYGSNAMGGVVNIISRRMHTDGVHTSLSLGAGSYGTVQAEASNQVRAGRFSSTVAAQFGRSDNHRPDMGFYQYGGYVSLGYDLSSHWNIFADADVTHFGASYPGTVSAPMLEADQWITRGAVAIGVENRYRNTSGRISVYDNFGRHKINDGYAAGSGTPQTRLFRSRDALAGISWYQTASLWLGGNITLGMDYQHIYGRAFYTSRQTGEVLETANKQSGHVHNNEVGVYADIRQDLLRWLSVEAGVRYDRHSVTGGEWVPQGGIVVRPSASAEVKAMVSKGFRNPTMKELYLYPPSNEDLLPERMMNYELSWRHRLLGGRLGYGINLFYIKADNIIQTINRKNVNTGKLENSGIEADATFAIDSRWSVTTNHSYLHQARPVVGAPTYKGYIGGSFHSNGVGVHAGLTQVAGLYTAVGSDETKTDFTLLNVTVDYRLCKNVKLWVKGDNLLGQRYEIVAGNPMPKATFMAGVALDF